MFQHPYDKYDPFETGRFWNVSLVVYRQYFMVIYTVCCLTSAFQRWNMGLHGPRDYDRSL